MAEAELATSAPGAHPNSEFSPVLLYLTMNLAALCGVKGIDIS